MSDFDQRFDEAMIRIRDEKTITQCTFCGKEMEKSYVGFPQDRDAVVYWHKDGSPDCYGQLEPGEKVVKEVSD